MTRIAFIGVGNMGLPMVRNLLAAGHEVRAYDVSPGALAEAVQEEIDMIALGGPMAVQECKKLVRRVPELSIAQGFAETAPWSARLFNSEEAAEGMAAFREKRAPAWTQQTTEQNS